MRMSTSNSRHSSKFFTKNNEKIYPKGRALMQMYVVVPQTKRWNAIDFCALNSGFWSKEYLTYIMRDFVVGMKIRMTMQNLQKSNSKKKGEIWYMYLSSVN